VEPLARICLDNSINEEQMMAKTEQYPFLIRNKIVCLKKGGNADPKRSYKSVEKQSSRNSKRKAEQEERHEKHNKALYKEEETKLQVQLLAQYLGAPPIRSMLLIILLLDAIPEGLGIPLPILLCTGAAVGASLNAGMEA
jgi:hypothetical protein